MLPRRSLMGSSLTLTAVGLEGYKHAGMLIEDVPDALGLPE